MIDLHFHCLPGIDDGPADWDQAVALCRAAAAEGTTKIVATPHVLRDRWQNEDVAVRDQLVMKLNDLLGGTPAVLPGCEYYFSDDALELWEQGNKGPLVGLNRGSYLLLEFPPTKLPRVVEAVFHELSLIGVTPVIAHPERHFVFAKEPEQLERLVDLGAIAQITAGSLVGTFGDEAERAAHEFFRRGIAYVVASDAHSLARRPPQLAEARARVRAEWGGDVERSVFETAPAAIINDAPADALFDLSAVSQ